jgi:hypothetical protein
MGRLCAGSVVEACSFFLGVHDFRDAALAVVKQVGGPKSDAKRCSEWCAVKHMATRCGLLSRVLEQQVQNKVKCVE